MSLIQLYNNANTAFRFLKSVWFEISDSPETKQPLKGWRARQVGNRVSVSLPMNAWKVEIPKLQDYTVDSCIPPAPVHKYLAKFPAVRQFLESARNIAFRDRYANEG